MKKTIISFITILMIHGYGLKLFSNYYSNNEKLMSIRSRVKLNMSKQAAKNQAIKDTFKKALTKKIEHLISREKFELHFELLNIKILSKSSKYIKRFVIKKQGVINEEYEVLVDLSIDELKLRRALASIGLLFSEKNYYKGLLMLSIKSSETANPEYWWRDSSISNSNKSLMQYLISKPELTSPVLMIDPFALELKNKIPDNLSVLHLRKEELQTIGKILSVDIIYYGTITVKASKKSDQVKQLLLSSSTKTLNIKTGRFISQTSFEGKTSVSNDQFENQENNFIRQAAIKNLTKSTKNIIETWVNGTYNSTAYTLVLRGILSFEEFQKIKYFLKNDIKSINSVEEYVLGKHQKTLIIESNTSLSTINDDITRHPIENFKFETDKIDNEKLVLSVKRF